MREVISDAVISDAVFKITFPAMIALGFAHSVRKSAILGFLADIEKLQPLNFVTKKGSWST